jgi:hypothetical protein
MRKRTTEGRTFLKFTHTVRTVLFVVNGLLLVWALRLLVSINSHKDKHECKSIQFAASATLNLYLNRQVLERNQIFCQ